MRTAIQEMIRQIRGFTIELAAVENRDMLLWSPPGTSNHMIWHAGHSVWVQDVLCVKPLTGSCELPKEWERKFGQHCEPVASRTTWPEQTEIHELLQEQQQRLLELVGDLPEEKLVVNSDDPNDLVGGIIHGLHDEARHHGEMYLLFKQFNAMTK
jgi:hypothetical protein